MGYEYEFMKEKWAKGICSELEAYLINFEVDEKRPPTLKEAVSEAEFALSTYFEPGHACYEELKSKDRDVKKEARTQVRKLKAFIRKYGNKK
jgi:hypothetical protein